MLRNLLVSAMILGATMSVAAADILVESRTGGQNNSGYSEPQGRWLDSNTPAATAKSSAAGLTADIGSRKTTVVPNSGAPADSVLSSARFTPPVIEPGDYHVYLTYPRAANATPVTVYVKHANGEDRKQITQDGWGASGAGSANTWLEIGTYPFSAAGGQYVEVQVTGATGAADPANPVQAFADSVRFSTEALSGAAKTAPAVPGKTPAPATEAPANPAASTPTEPASSAASAPIEWASSLAAARSTAAANGKKVFVFFYSPESSRSTDYEAKVLKDPAVEKAIAAGYVAVKIDMDAEKALTNQLQVFRAGTINVYDGKSGAALGQITDTPEAAELVKRLAGF